MASFLSKVQRSPVEIAIVCLPRRNNRRDGGGGLWGGGREREMGLPESLNTEQAIVSSLPT